MQAIVAKPPGETGGGGFYRLPGEYENCVYDWSFRYAMDDLTMTPEAAEAKARAKCRPLQNRGFSDIQIITTD